MLPQQTDPDAGPDDKSKPNVGLIIARCSTAGTPQLLQQAIVRGDNHLYYLIEFTTPGSKAIDGKTEEPNERAAVGMFQKVLDTVHLVDTSKIREEQEKRLYATRAFLTNLTPAKLRKALVPEQWYRILINGKDVGYTYVMEQLAGGLPEPDADLVKCAREGRLTDEEKSRPLLLPKILAGEDILVGAKTRVVIEGLRSNKTDGPIQTDSENWMFVTADRKHEDWSRLIVQHDETRKKDAFSEELGTSDQHLVGLKAGATLTVTQSADAVNLPPLNQEVPPFYLPGAAGHLLPRLFDVRERKAIRLRLVCRRATRSGDAIYRCWAAARGGPRWHGLQSRSHNRSNRVRRPADPALSLRRSQPRRPSQVPGKREQTDAHAGDRQRLAHHPEDLDHRRERSPRRAACSAGPASTAIKSNVVQHITPKSQYTYVDIVGLDRASPRSKAIIRLALRSDP